MPVLKKVTFKAQGVTVTQGKKFRRYTTPIIEIFAFRAQIIQCQSSLQSPADFVMVGKCLQKIRQLIFALIRNILITYYGMKVETLNK
jgi:hypothetical protein